MMRPVHEGLSTLVMVSTNIIRARNRYRPSIANGTTGPAPVLKITLGLFALRIKNASTKLITMRQSLSACVMKCVRRSMSSVKAMRSLRT